jgi:hypothetical protein
VQDIRIIWDKAYRFMKEDGEAYKRARELSQFFELRVKEIE